MNTVKRIGFAIVNLFLTVIYFTLMTFLLIFSTAPDNYGNKETYIADEPTIFPILIPLFFLTLGLTQYLTFKIKPEKMLDALYAEFIVLKWLTLGTAILGCFATWWFYHSAGVGAHIAMVIWWGIYGLVYLVIARIAGRITTLIADKKNEIKWNNLIDRLSK